MINAEDFISALSLQVLSPTSRRTWDIHSAELNRPGLQFVGFYEHFAYDRPQVVGHHPHTVQGLRVENGKTTLWSLGNFVFGGNPSLNYKNPARNKLLNIETFIAQITFSFDEDQRYLGQQINIIPCYTSGTAEYNNYQPVPVTGAEAEKVLSAIQVDSYPLHLKPYVEGVGAVQDFVPAPAK